MNKELFGKRINTARKEAQITGEHLAESCEISATFLRQIEAGKRLPSLPIFIRIANRLGVSPNYLLQDSLEDGMNDTMASIVAMCENANAEQLRIIKAVIEAVQG